MRQYSIVILIDLKKRDLLGACLIAHHLEKSGVRVHLEPIESWRSCIYAWKPDMIIFNHLLHEHVTALSAQLHRMGVLVGCLLNEGLALSDSAREYLSEPQYPDVHCDLFLTWNQPLADSLIKNNFVSPPENAVTVGVPRFDFYHKPWSSYYEKPAKSERTRILFNTTFALSHFYERTPEERETLYRSLGNGKIPELLDYNKLIDDHFHSREKVAAYLAPLLESGKYDITLRPHPREDVHYYEQLVEQLPPEQQKLIKVDRDDPIFSAILNCDITLNCEDCTTSAESWIAGKPTLTLTFEKNPIFFTRFYSDCSPRVEDPAEILEGVERQMNNPDQEDYQKPRQEYLNKWLYKTDGQSALRAAEAIHRVLHQKTPQPNFPLSFSGTRRGIKVKLMRKLNEPGHSKLKHVIKRAIFRDRVKMSIRYRDYLKAIRPSDVSKARARLHSISSDLKQS